MACSSSSQVGAAVVVASCLPFSAACAGQLVVSQLHIAQAPVPAPCWALHPAGVKPLVMRYQQESGSAASTPKPSGSASSTPVSSLVPRVASEAALAAMGLNPLVPGGSSAALASLLAGAGAHAATAPPTIAGSLHGEGSGSDDGGALPVPNLSNK